VTAAVRSSDDPEVALEAAGGFLRARPVEHNLLLSLLTQRVDRPEEGRYWWATEAGRVVGFVFQSPTRFRALVSPAAPSVVDALVEVAAEEAPGLPGVMGEAAAAARFAGQWSERRHVAVVPTEGQRLYRLATVRPPQGVPGRMRAALPEDCDQLVRWAAAFVEETGGHPQLPGDIVDRHLRHGRLWVWDDGNTPVSMAAASTEVAGVARVAFVYTPPERRGQGYAAACVASVSEEFAAAGQECVLYAQLHNPTSNAVYRRIGYEPAMEVLIYRFG
jgi:predicted GNAT family acetyltransferase